MSGLSTHSTVNLVPSLAAPMDIFCPLMGGRPYQRNYRKIACRERQRHGTCNNTQCVHRDQRVRAQKESTKGSKNSRLTRPVSAEEKRDTSMTGVPRRCDPAIQGTPPGQGVTAGETAQTNKGGRPKKVYSKEETVAKNKVKTCADCATEKTIIGRGLCGKCYWKYKHQGTLDEKFPTTRTSPKKKVTSPSASEKTSPCPDARADRVLLIFEQRDHALLKYLRDLAARERRTVEWQIVAMLDRVVAGQINGEAT